MNLQAPFILIPWDYWFFLQSLNIESYRLVEEETHKVVIPNAMVEDFTILQGLSRYGINQTQSEDRTKIIQTEILSEKFLNRFKDHSEACEVFKCKLIRKSLSSKGFQIQFWIFGNKESLEKLSTYFDSCEVEYLSPPKIKASYKSYKIFEFNPEKLSSGRNFLGLRYPN